MKKLIFKTFLYCLPLFFVPLVLYVIIDPFQVIYSTKDYNTKKDYLIANNRDFQSTELFLKNYKKYNIDSYIFGNSRSFFYQAKKWDSLTKGKSFHFNASSESIYGINCKLKLIDKLHVKMKNALIIWDAKSFVETKNSEGHLLIKHPAISKESTFMFQLEMFKAFYSKAMVIHTDLYFTSKKKDYMTEFGVLNNVLKVDMVSNQLTYAVYDKLIATNPELYYSDKMSLFYSRDKNEKFSEQYIFKEQKKILKNICSILKSHKTKYKIIISPLYDQLKMDKKDLDYLKKIFDKDKIFDFSGINSFTNDYRNYYENSHYRPLICDTILNLIYKKK